MLGTRVITGAVLGVVVIATLVWLSTEMAALIFGAFWLAGAWEWAALAGLSGATRFGYAVLQLILMIALWRLGIGSDVATLVIWLALPVWAVAFGGVLTYPRHLPRPIVAFAGVVVLVPAWIAVLRLHASGAIGPGLALTAIAIVGAADVGAYFTGRSFGRIKLAPLVSPGKTWEGVAGGMGLALVVGAMAAWLLSLPPAVMIPAAGILALVSVVGDLSVSMLKRNVGLKDCSGLLPGHGGVMDRIDGLTAALPFFAIGLQLAGLLD